MQCDIIMPVWNNLAFTKDCIDSIMRNTDIDYSLVIIDNGSDEETRAYLDGLRGLGKPRVELIKNNTNLGFIKAVNRGIALSKAAYICVLNNDTIVTKGWLKTMIDVADSEGDIGVVNPSSNNLGQRPEKGEPIELYADRLKRSSSGFVELGSAIGFCMLIKREVIERIGYFDEIYGMGNFEDTDFSRRAIREGYRCVRACAAYVYHRERSSFKRLKGFDEGFRRNREIYEFRWGRPKRVAYLLDAYGPNILKRLEFDSMKLARDGNWIWFFSKERLSLPAHSNIKIVEFSKKHFNLKAVFKILTKKKKFDEIFVGNERFGHLLEKLSFIHRARVEYY